MVNTGGGGSVTRTSLWIQNYVTKNKLPIQIQIAHYGASINNKYSQILEAAGIETDSIHLGSAPGTPGYLAKETLTENFAPYDEWNPLKAASRPAFHSHLRRAYPYYNSSNQKEFSHFASYDDLIELFKKVDPIAFIREQSPATYKVNCNQGLTSFRN